MNEKQLLQFIHRILRSQSLNQASLALNELHAILKAQNADPALISLVVSAKAGGQEAQASAREQNALTPEALEIATRRESERRAREEAAARYNRC